MKIESLTSPAPVDPGYPPQRRSPSRPPRPGPGAVSGMVRVGVRREQVGAGLGQAEPAGVRVCVAQALWCGAAQPGVYNKCMVWLWRSAQKKKHSLSK